MLHSFAAFAAGDLLKDAREKDYLDAEFVQAVVSLKEEINQLRDPAGKTVLHLLMGRSHQARALIVLLAGGDVNVRDARGRTPLFDCLEAHDPNWKGDADFMNLEMLVLRGADVNARDLNELTPLAVAVAQKDRRKAEFLIWSGAELKPAGIRPEKTPLGIAYANRDQQMIDLLKAAEKLQQDESSTSSPRSSRRVSDALTAADLNAVEELVGKGWNLNEPDELGRTALFRAVENRRPDLVSLLVFEGADPNIATKTGKTPLMMSLPVLGIDGQRMMGLLLLQGANVAAATKDGTTALIVAASASHDYGVLSLIAAGADPKAPTPKGSLMSYVTHPPTAALLTTLGVEGDIKRPELKPVALMFAAAQRGDAKAVEEWLNKGVPVDAEYDVERTALSWAVNYGRFNVADLLLQRGANINKQFRTSGHHLLHDFAARGGTGEDANMKSAARGIEYLVKHGANPDIAMRDGTTPLMVAAKEGIIGPNTEALLKAGANINARNKAGLTPLGIARKNGRDEMAALLKMRGAVE